MSDSRKIRVLYVDDRARDRAPVRDALQSDEGGFEVVEACTRDELERQIALDGFSLVLSDFHLQGFDGLDVIDAARGRRPELPVVIMTGTGSEETAVRALRHGAAEYVIKTADEIRRLPQTLHSVLHDARAASARARGRDTLERRLADCDRKLDAASRELEAFTYSVSHDLRSPLRIIDGFARMLTDEYSKELPSRAASHLQVIRASAARMGELIDRLMDFAQVSREPLARHEVEVEPLVRDVLRETRSASAAHEPAVRIEPLPRCRADRVLLRQVLANLVGNAFKYTRGRERPEIVVGCRAEPGTAPAYFVKDNGAGFDMRYADRLFKVFQRLHRPEEYEGTGIGLAIVRRIVSRHGGKAWAEAVPGRGATFWFTLEGEENGTA